VKLAARWVLAAASLALFVGVLLLAVVHGPREARLLLLAFAVLAGGAAVQRRRLLDTGVLVLLGLVGVLAVEAVVVGGVAGGRIAVALAALALGTLGLVMFQRGDPAPPAHGDDRPG